MQRLKPVQYPPLVLEPLPQVPRPLRRQVRLQQCLAQPQQRPEQVFLHQVDPPALPACLLDPLHHPLEFDFPVEHRLLL